jgi:hypothetical protein
MSLYVSFLGDYASKDQNSLAGKLQYMKFNASLSLSLSLSLASTSYPKDCLNPKIMVKFFS